MKKSKEDKKQRKNKRENERETKGRDSITSFYIKHHWPSKKLYRHY